MFFKKAKKLKKLLLKYFLRTSSFASRGVCHTSLIRLDLYSTPKGGANDGQMILVAHHQVRVNFIFFPFFSDTCWS
jgi:hypothetical protein